MRRRKVQSPYGEAKVSIWSDAEGQEPYIMIANGSTVWVEMGKSGLLAAPCEYRRRKPPYRGMVSLEDLVPPIGLGKGGVKSAKSPESAPDRSSSKGITPNATSEAPGDEVPGRV